jgi:hypothetical protein
MVPVVVFDAMRGVGLAVGRQPSKLIYTGSIPVPRSKFLYQFHCSRLAVQDPRDV